MESKSLLKTISAIGLILTIIPSFFVFAGVITLDIDKLLMLFGTLFWFICSPFWMNQKS